MKTRRLFPEPNTVLIFSTLLIVLLSLGSQVKSAVPSQRPTDHHQPLNFVGKSGMVVAAHPLAAKTGLKTLMNGGNAVDAAVATALALNAAEPFASGIGGGGFMVIYLASAKKVTVINYREKAPSRASPEMFYEEGKLRRDWKRTHGLAVAVPGALAGWTYALKKYGTQPLDDVIEEAIAIAEQGLKISTTFSAINKDEYEKLILNDGEESCYLNQGLPYEPGEVFKNPDLARTLKTLATKGPEEFYKGEIAKRIIQAVQEKGGFMTLEDLAQYKPLEQEPLVGEYKNFTLYTISPPGSGGLHIIQLLNIIENWPLKKWGPNTPAYIHHFCEALRFVFADRARYLGDPEFVRIPVRALLSKAYASEIASKIQPDRLLNSYPPGSFDERENEKENTTHLCVIDKEGNIVSLTQSINHFFGSGIVPDQTGFLLNNHMDDFANDPNSINAPRPGRRSVSSMGPLIFFKNQDPFLVLGSPGGTRIFPSLTQIILNIVEFGMSLDEAIEAPRFFTYSSLGQARNVDVESRIPVSVIRSLEAIGHKVVRRKAYDKYFGGAQGLLILKGKNLILGGADSRRDGYGAGY